MRGRMQTRNSVIRQQAGTDKTCTYVQDCVGFTTRIVVSPRRLRKWEMVCLANKARALGRE